MSEARSCWSRAGAATTRNGAGPRASSSRDAVSIPPETKHWHGAASDSWFSHVAIAVPAEGASNEWLEPVADEEYAALA